MHIFGLEKFCKDKRIPYILEGHHHCKNGWAQINCPFCTNGLHGWHMGFNLERGNFNCWRCGSKSVWDVISAILHVKNKSQVYKTIKEYGVTQRGKRTQESITRKRSVKAPPGTSALGEQHRTYLKNRGLDPDEIIKLWNVKGTKHLSGKWSWRIVYPICNVEGRIVAYQGRTIRKNTKPTYKMIENDKMVVDPKFLLYGIEAVKGDSIIVVEGIFDVWKLGPGAVATFGIDWSAQQANQLRKYKRVFIIFDPEEKAQKKAKQLAYYLSMYAVDIEIITGFHTDPGDIDKIEAEKITETLLG